jgi:CBS domain-containing protein
MGRFPLDVSDYMSSVLVVIGAGQPLSEAIRLMRLHGVRHLPVLRKNKIVGILSQRDVYRMQSVDKTNPAQILVSEAMTAKPYTVEPDERIDRVARHMVRRSIGTALVTYGDDLLGLFTGTDALLALAALVEDDEVPGEPREDDGPVQSRGHFKRRMVSSRSKPAKPKSAPHARRARSVS